MAPAAGGESGVMRDEFGFRGFNTAADVGSWGALLPQYTVITDKDGFASQRGPLYDPAPSTSLYGAKVQLPFPQNVETFFPVVAVTTQPPAVDNAKVIVEFIHKELDHYFITLDDNEIGAIDYSGVFPGWSRSVGGFIGYERESGRAEDSVPVCRFFSSVYTSHFFTADPDECDAVIAKWSNVWTLESRNVFYIAVPDKTTGACTATTQPVYRLYNNRLAPNHRYVTDRKLRDAMVAAGWVAEGHGPDSVVMCAQK